MSKSQNNHKNIFENISILYQQFRPLQFTRSEGLGVISLLTPGVSPCTRRRFINALRHRSFETHYRSQTLLLRLSVSWISGISTLVSLGHWFPLQSLFLVTEWSFFHTFTKNLLLLECCLKKDKQIAAATASRQKEGKKT